MQETSEPRHPRRSRRTIAAYLAFAAVAADALLIVLGSSSSGLGLPLAILASGAWILAVLLFSPIRDAPPQDRAGTMVGRVASIAAVAHVIAFLLPAAYGNVALDGPVEAIPGYFAFTAGFVVVPLAWLANPLFIVAFALHRRGAHRRAAALAAVATVLALSVLFTLPNLPVGPGFLLWATSPALLAIAAALAQRTVEVREPTPPSDS